MLLSLRSEPRPPYTRQTFWADSKAGITLVASYVPTATALGVISGMGPLAGLWCGVFVGIIAAVCGGTRAMVSGPSAVLAVITATPLTGNEVSLPELAVIIVMAGAIQVMLRLTGRRRFVSYMPHIVLTGFMSGIGVLLLATQVEKLFLLGTSDMALAAICLVVFLVWPSRLDNYIPAPLAAVGIGWIVAIFIPDTHQLSPVPVGLPIPVLEIPSLEFLPKAVGPAVLIALISSVYTLMWSLIADTFNGSRHNPNRDWGISWQGSSGCCPGAGTSRPCRRAALAARLSSRVSSVWLSSQRSFWVSVPTQRRCRWRCLPRLSCSSAGG